MPGRPSFKVQYGFPVIPSIDFVLKGDAWFTRIEVNGQRWPFPTVLDIDAIKAISQDLIDAIGNQAFGADFKASPGKAARQSRLVAEHGRKLYEALIRKDLRTEFLGALRRAQPSTGGRGGRQRGLVSLHEQACRVWWQLLYVGPLNSDGAVNPRDFLGHDFLFVALADAPKVGSFEAGAGQPDALRKGIAGDGRLATGHVWDNQLLVSTFPLDERWYDGLPGLARVDFDPALDVNVDRQAETDRLADFVTLQAHDTLHFDCHGRPQHAGREWMIDLGVRNDFLVPNDEVKKWRFLGNPLLISIMNTCLAGRGQLYENQSSVAEALVANGVAAAMAPMAKAPLLLLMELSRAIYEELLGARSFLRAFDAAQSSLLAGGNIGALAFTLYAASMGDAGIRFDQLDPPNTGAI